MDEYQYTSHKKLLIFGEAKTGKSTFIKLLMGDNQPNEDLEEIKAPENECN